MQVNPSHHSDPIRQSELARRSGTSPRPTAEGTAFERSAALNQSLANTPEVRPQAVERARRLIADTSYPPQEAINKIANLLAMSLTEGAQPGGDQ